MSNFLQHFSRTFHQVCIHIFVWRSLPYFYTYPVRYVVHTNILHYEFFFKLRLAFFFLPKNKKSVLMLRSALTSEALSRCSSSSTIKDLFTTFDLFVVIVIPCVIKRRTQNCTLTGSCKNPLQSFGFILIISAPFQRLYVLLCAAIFLLLLLL